MDYLLVFLWCVLSASIVPISSEPYYMSVVVKYQSMYLPLIIATIGNTLGGLTTFLIGRKGGEIIVKRASDKNKARYDQAVNFIHRFGPVSMLISWIPLFGDAIVSIGGALKLPVARSTFWMFLGKFFRYLLLGAIALGIWN